MEEMKIEGNLEVMEGWGALEEEIANEDTPAEMNSREAFFPPTSAPAAISEGNGNGTQTARGAGQEVAQLHRAEAGHEVEGQLAATAEVGDSEIPANGQMKNFRERYWDGDESFGSGSVEVELFPSSEKKLYTTTKKWEHTDNHRVPTPPPAEMAGISAATLGISGSNAGEDDGGRAATRGGRKHKKGTLTSGTVKPYQMLGLPEPPPSKTSTNFYAAFSDGSRNLDAEKAGPSSLGSSSCDRGIIMPPPPAYFSNPPRGPSSIPCGPAGGGDPTPGGESAYQNAGTAAAAGAHPQTHPQAQFAGGYCSGVDGAPQMAHGVAGYNQLPVEQQDFSIPMNNYHQTPTGHQQVEPLLPQMMDATGVGHGQQSYAVDHFQQHSAQYDNGHYNVVQQQQQPAGVPLYPAAHELSEDHRAEVCAGTRGLEPYTAEGARPRLEQQLVFPPGPTAHHQHPTAQPATNQPHLEHLSSLTIGQQQSYSSSRTSPTPPDEGQHQQEGETLRGKVFEMKVHKRGIYGWIEFDGWERRFEKRPHWKERDWAVVKGGTPGPALAIAQRKCNDGEDVYVEFTLTEVEKEGGKIRPKATNIRLLGEHDAADQVDLSAKTVFRGSSAGPTTTISTTTTAVPSPVDYHMMYNSPLEYNQIQMNPVVQAQGTNTSQHGHYELQHYGPSAPTDARPWPHQPGQHYGVSHGAAAPGYQDVAAAGGYNPVAGAAQTSGPHQMAEHYNPGAVLGHIDEAAAAYQNHYQAHPYPHHDPTAAAGGGCWTTGTNPEYATAQAWQADEASASEEPDPRAAGATGDGNISTGGRGGGGGGDDAATSCAAGFSTSSAEPKDDVEAAEKKENKTELGVRHVGDVSAEGGGGDARDAAADPEVDSDVSIEEIAEDGSVIGGPQLLPPTTRGGLLPPSSASSFSCASASAGGGGLGGQTCTSPRTRENRWLGLYAQKQQLEDMVRAGDERLAELCEEKRKLGEQTSETEAKLTKDKKTLAELDKEIHDLAMARLREAQVQ